MPSYSSNLWGRKSWGKFLGEWNIWHEAEFALPKGYSGGAHQEGSCESGILSFPSFHTYHIKIKALLVSGSLVVNHAHWLQLLCPPCLTVAGCYDQYTRWSVSFLNSHQSAQLRLRSPRLIVVEEISMKASPRLLLSKAEVSKELSQVDQDWLLWADPRLALTPEDTEFFTSWFSQ